MASARSNPEGLRKATLSYLASLRAHEQSLQVRIRELEAERRQVREMRSKVRAALEGGENAQAGRRPVAELIDEVLLAAGTEGLTFHDIRARIPPPQQPTANTISTLLSRHRDEYGWEHKRENGIVRWSKVARIEAKIVDPATVPTHGVVAVTGRRPRLIEQ